MLRRAGRGVRKRGNWSVGELDRLRSAYGRVAIERLARELGRSEHALRRRAVRMLGCKAQPGPLTAADEDVLRTMAGIADIETMCLVLARRRSEVLDVLARWRATRRRGRFAEWELAYLEACYPTRPNRAVSFVLGRSEAACVRRAETLCLGKAGGIVGVEIPDLLPVVVLEPAPRRRTPRWSRAETGLLRKQFASRSNLQLARSLGRSVKSIVAKANKLGLRKSAARLRRMGKENVSIRHFRMQRGKAGRRARASSRSQG